MGDVTVATYEGIIGQLSTCDSGTCSYTCISKVEVTEKNVLGVANLQNFFFSPTNKTQQLHLLKLFIAGAQILFYESQIKKHAEGVLL